MSARRELTHREKTSLPQINGGGMMFSPALVSELTDIFPLIGINRIDIRFSEKKIERSGRHFTVIKKRVDPITDDRQVKPGHHHISNMLYIMIHELNMCFFK